MMNPSRASNMEGPDISDQNVPSWREQKKTHLWQTGQEKGALGNLRRS